MISRKALFSWVFERHRKLQLLILVMVLVTIFLRVFPLEMQKRIVNVAIRMKDIHALFLYSGLYITAVVLAGVLKYLINVLQGYIGQKILYDMRSQLYEHILRLPLSFFRRTSPGLVISSLTSELSTVGDFLGSALAIPLINILSLAAFAGFMFYLNPLLALASIAIYPIEIAIIPSLQKRFNRLNMTRIGVTRSLSGVIGEAITGMHEIHGSSSYHVENQKMGGLASRLFSLRHRMNITKFLIKFVNNFFQSLGPFILFLLGGYLSIRGRLDLGALVAFLSAYEKLYDPWKELMDYYQSLQDSRVRYYQVMSYFDVTPEFVLLPEDGRKPYDLTGKIDVRDVDFVVDGQIRILDSISLSIEPGEQLALVGLSGSGKSTLAMVMGQLYNYTRGHVLMDGKELKAFSKLDVSHNIGYVAQKPFIFDGSIRENLLYACQALLAPNGEHSGDLPKRADILKVIEAVGLADDILRIGLNTLIAEGKHPDLATRLVELRKTFHERWGAELRDVVDFFDEDRFLYYANIAQNITFGDPRRPEYEVERLAENRTFRDFLQRFGLIEPLLELGSEVARQTVYLLRDIEEDEFFFEMSPIRRDEFRRYVAIVDRWERFGRDRLTRTDNNAILLLALRFVPSIHKMAALSIDLENRILAARIQFMKEMSGRHQEAFAFFRPTEYLYTQNLMENILFGHPKVDQFQAIEKVQHRVVDLLKERELLDEVLDVGLDFQVGSMGERLSGGQKQKIALARVLLKNPRIIILDEATASLDNTSQARIQELFNSELRSKCTLIAVVHRLEMVLNYDLIAVMKAGKVVEMGRYEELMQRKGLFYELAHGSV